MKTTIKFIAAAAAALTLGSAGLAWAQPAAGSPTTPDQTQGMKGMPGEGHGGMHGPRHGHGHGRPVPTAAEMAAHLDKLKAELNITPAQAGAWQQFVDTARTQAEAHAARRTEMQAKMQAWRQAKKDGAAPPATPERDAWRAQMRQQREADKAARDSARTALYAVLTPEQKAVADQRLRGGRHEGRGPGHRRGGADGQRPAG